jgi:hypothetical protein
MNMIVIKAKSKKPFLSDDEPAPAKDEPAEDGDKGHDPAAKIAEALKGLEQVAELLKSCLGDQGY